MGDFLDGSQEAVTPALDPMHLQVEPVELEDPFKDMTAEEFAQYRKFFRDTSSSFEAEATTVNGDDFQAINTFARRDTAKLRTSKLRTSMIETPDPLRVRASSFLQGRLGRVGLRRLNR